jgi:hypothetical protein
MKKRGKNSISSRFSIEIIKELKTANYPIFLREIVELNEHA